MSTELLIKQIFLYPRPFILTGAGVSTESGIPDFRGSGGLWERIDPMEVFSAWAFKHHPEKLYQHSKEVFGTILEALPNAAHNVLGEWQQKRIIGPIVTQNIDNLHQKGGAFWVYEVHGHIRTATCSRCGKTVQDMQEIIKEQETGVVVPRCADCGGVLKPDVILFGDAMPEDYMYAVKMAEIFNHFPQVVLVVGSSLAVSPINSFPLSFEELDIINNAPTLLDQEAYIIINGLAGKILMEMHKMLIDFNGGKDIQVLPAGFIPGRLISIVEGFYKKIWREQEDHKKPLTKWAILQGDIELIKNLFAFYKEKGRQQRLEYYLLEQMEEKLQLMEQGLKQVLQKRKFNLQTTEESYLLSSLYRLVDIYNQALHIYAKQHNAESRVIKELALQYLGIAGLYNKLWELKGIKSKGDLASDIDRVEKLMMAKGLSINTTQALADF
ncbi:NAD-dependent protein deacetylase, SIR2 family [Thermosyntropha lipolytica DSM 11003]|uniref:protein acetyllysine N-acetyltransferase n=1 Tax=Thermosyntropha lipolytica DSM 11003 TaxID=1123382 RepID=A0A1M5MUD1_9FIRM|nr:Sir2 family NAD-dependent protein deacetylase [Thermosyntropha lipolytica]SHG80881.1 NAD-dependent protein deacetylase, SIR2 family [Thermosyntropha lipolytica DSM 11003]